MEHTCTQIVSDLIAGNRWFLLERNEFIHRTMSHLLSNPTHDPFYAATYIYSQVLHDSCLGKEGMQRQRQACAELFQYLIIRARRRYLTGYHAAAQHALETIYASIEYCPQPHAFLAFAVQHLVEAVWALEHDTSHKEGGQATRSLEI